MQVLLKIGNDRTFAQTGQDLGQIAFDQRERQRDLARHLQVALLVVLTLAACGVLGLAQGRKGTDVIGGQGPEIYFWLFYRSQEHVHREGAVQGVLFGFHVDEPLVVGVVRCQVFDEGLRRSERIFEEFLGLGQLGYNRHHLARVRRYVLLGQGLQDLSLREEVASGGLVTFLALADH